MTPHAFQFLCGLIKERSGIVITPDKAYLVENRLGPIATRLGFASLDMLVDNLRTHRDEQRVREVVEAMTTNESLFFRDTKPFEMLRTTLLPMICANRRKGGSVRIWSAACSSGQEPYSLAILLKEAGAAFADWRFEILATDIASTMITKARAGIYSQFEVQRGMPIKLLVKYFKQIGTQWEIQPEIKAMVTFREHNILNNATGLGSFDVILCRNVLIYFDTTTKSDILNRMSRLLAPDGVLFLGGTETVIGISSNLEPMPQHRGVYRRCDQPPRAAAAGRAG